MWSNRLKKSALFVTIMVMCSMIGQFATEIYLPSMPSMASYFAVDIAKIQFTITTYALGFAFGSLFCGYLSDKLGRLKVVFPCLVLSICGGLACCMAFSPQWLLFGRFFQGMGLGGVSVVARSIIRDVSASRNEFAKFASILGSTSAAAIAFAPVLGGYIEKFLFWRINFIVLLVFSLVLSWLCKFKLIETNRQIEGKIMFRQMLGEYVSVITNRKFLLYNLASSLTLAGFISYQTVSAFLLQVKLGLEPHQFGYTSIFVTLALVLGGVFNGRLVERHGIDIMLRFGAIMYIISGLILSICGLFDYMSVSLIVVPVVLFTFAAGMVYPNASSGALTIFTSNVGSAASLYNCFQMLGAAIGSWIISLTVSKNQLPLGVMFILIGMTAMMIYQAIIKKQQVL